MEKFIPLDVRIIDMIDNIPELIQTIKDGSKRTINFKSGLVTIHDKDGNLLSKDIFDINHPLIENAKVYYFFHHTLKTDARISRILARMRRRKELPLGITDCEEFYKIKTVFGCCIQNK